MCTFVGAQGLAPLRWDVFLTGSPLDKTKELSQFPFQGQKVSELDELNIYQLILKPYCIIYRIEEDKKQVSILRLWHAPRFSPEL
ncbi:MAG: type II toxin-antitoxin system RelE/ParE family toxin [Nostoc sp.]|uniref:type II toxin-antitoxin system RelE/ParE family toxin n=1 Tax=Nostoc sp. TaxID=1180 RepID=UPI002FF741BA